MKKRTPLLVVTTLVMACTFAVADQSDVEGAAFSVKIVTAKKCKKKGQTQIFNISTTATPGSADPRWTQTFPSAMPAIGKTPYPGWIAPASGSDHWVQATAGSGATSVAAGTYSYATSITIPAVAGFAYQYSLSGQWATDNTGKVFLNSSVISTCPSSSQASSLCFRYFTPLSATGTAPPGVNTLQVDDLNAGGPAGVLVEAQLTLTCKKAKK